MLPRLLLDTHILVRWLVDSKKLSRQQLSALNRAMQRGQPVAISAITFLEIVLLAEDGRLAFDGELAEFLESIHSNPVFRLLPLSYEVALEIASLEVLKDPADRTIVATARAHGLQLVTADERIIDSKLVPVID